MKKFNVFAVLCASWMVHSSVFAQAAAPAAASGFDTGNLIGFGLLFVVFFVFIIWPQNKKAKKHAEFIRSLQRGDAVITASGIYGKIYGLADTVVTLEIANGVRIRVDRQTISSRDSTAGASSEKLPQAASGN